jgi:phage shock protein A
LTHQPKPKGGRGAVKTRLTSLSDVIGELGQIYRAVKARKMPEERGKTLAWILGQLRSALEAQSLERLEQRLDELAPAMETRGEHGYQPDKTRAARIAH